MQFVIGSNVRCTTGAYHNQNGIVRGHRDGMVLVKWQHVDRVVEMHPTSLREVRKVHGHF